MKRVLMAIGAFLCLTSVVNAGVMPEPKVTHFSTGEGEAPVASASGATVNLASGAVSSNADYHPHIITTESDTAASGTAPLIDTSGISQADQLKILQRQVDSIAKQSYSSKIASLEQEIEVMKGQLAEQQNELKETEKKLNQFYVQLDQRMTKDEQLAGREDQNPGVSTIKSESSKPKVKKNDSSSDVVKLGSEKENALFKKATNLLNQDNYAQAKTVLLSYLKAYPHGSNELEAHFWLGEINYSKQNYSDAEKQFNLVVQNGKDKKRIEVSELRLARIYMNTSRSKLAKPVLVKLIHGDPNGAVGKLAALYMKQISA
jgi:TolA-binding protein